MRPVRHPGELRWETRLLGVVTLTLLVVGLVSTYSATNVLQSSKGQVIGLAFALKQIVGVALGGVLLLIASRLDYYRWRQLAWPMLLVTVGLLLLLLLPGVRSIAPQHNGARRWIDIGPINFQPSELARFVVVIWCAMLATKKGAEVRGFKRGVLPFIVVLGGVSLLIYLEPNLSMAVLVAMLGGLVLFTAGAKIGHFVLLTVLAALLTFNRIQSTPFRAARMKTYKAATAVGTPADDRTYQIHNSLVGIGSGRVFGVGFGEGQQKLGYLPYATSDFLFSSIGEEWGFIGICTVVTLYGLFCWLGFRIAKTAPDPFGQYLAVGLTATVGVTAFMHMAVSLGLMPTTGLTLPFMSYGRSSLVISLLGTGILINIGRLRGKRMPERKAAKARDER
jgi:cell division protein FtsW